MSPRNKNRNSSMRPLSRRGQNKSMYSRKGPEGKSSGNDLLSALQGNKKKLAISYRAYEIIPRNSPYSHHFKSLLNAESFVSQKDFQMAVEIYQRLLNKIPLRSARDKIEQNIQDIENFSETMEEPFSPRVQLEVSYTGPPPGQLPPQLTGEKKEPLQLQMSTGTSPMQIGMAPGQQPVVLPFGFVQAQESADKETKEELSQGKNKPFGFFDQIQDTESADGYKRMSEDIVPQNNTEKLLKELSDGLFQIEKALFDTNRMKVESEEAPEGPQESGKAAAPPQHEKGAGQPEEEEEEPPIKQELRDEDEEEAELPSPEEAADEKGEEVTGKAEGPTEEEDLGEGIMEKTGEIGALDEAEEETEEEGEEEAKPAVQEIRGVLELKEPEQEDTPFITITYDFNKIPHHFFLSKDHNILEYAYYKYKPMLVKAQRFIRKKQITKALNYYRVIRDQQIPEALRSMVDKNIQDISEYLEKYLMTRPG